MTRIAPEWELAEHPFLRGLLALGWEYLPPPETRPEQLRPPVDQLVYQDNERLRPSLNTVILRDEAEAAVRRINGVDAATARRAVGELAVLADNETFLKRLRGDFSREVSGEARHKTLKLVDFLHPESNRFVVTNQLRVTGERSQRVDLVLYVNGFPLVVVEAKESLASEGRLRRAVDQIRRYERDLPRLFVSNLFNAVTDGQALHYGATGAKAEHWSVWKDPWPRSREDFQRPLDAHLFSLFAPERLLELLAHYVIFERRDGGVTKKVARYQQFRAVEKIVDRVRAGEERRGLVWHTQGSGKSLTMVFTALKLKLHRTYENPALPNPSLLVITDRVQLDQQIAGTFEACGVRNARRIDSIDDLRASLQSGVVGQTLITTIHKFEGLDRPVANSDEWVVLVDEGHRSQEGDLGAFLAATLPRAYAFGFTGTPVKREGRKTGRDTYAHFGPGTDRHGGESYLDRYSIEDAVRDGATVPVRYVRRKAEWEVDEGALDRLFESWFADAPAERRSRLRARGVTVADLAKHEGRVRALAEDLWAHFREAMMPDGLKGQVVAVDREAVVLYKRALDDVIAESFMAEGVPEDEARRRAAEASVPVISGNEADKNPGDTEYEEAVRRDLRRFTLTPKEEERAVERFRAEKGPPYLLIVCEKLLTGFDAPVEGVMYLDSPLKEHNLLQAIARTNRPYGKHKRYGLVVDTIGVTRHLDEALATYRREDVAGAMRDFSQLRSELRRAHREVMAAVREGLGGSPKPSSVRRDGELEAEYWALAKALEKQSPPAGPDTRPGEDAWRTFRRKGRALVDAYQALTPDPEVLGYRDDLKWVAGFLRWGRRYFELEAGAEGEEGVGEDYSGKVRELLAEHLRVTGIETALEIHDLTDPQFWLDFGGDGKAMGEKELQRAAIRKATELKKITREREEENPDRYAPFSERVREAIRRMEAGDTAEALVLFEEIARALEAEDRAHEGSGLTAEAYAIVPILDAFRDREGLAEPAAPAARELGELAAAIDALYRDEGTAPPGWQHKESLRKGLRQQVRRLVHGKGLGGDLFELSEQVESYALRRYGRKA